MTAQIQDTVHYLRKDFPLAGVSNDGLWTPESEGIQPDGMRDSACRRGYFANRATSVQS